MFLNCFLPWTTSWIPKKSQRQKNVKIFRCFRYSPMLRNKGPFRKGYDLLISPGSEICTLKFSRKMQSLHFCDSWLGVGNFLIDYSIPDRPILAHANLSIKLNDETPKRRIFFLKSILAQSLFNHYQKSHSSKDYIYLWIYVLFKSHPRLNTKSESKIYFHLLEKQKLHLPSTITTEQSHVLFLTWSHWYHSISEDVSCKWTQP